jgi:predicted RNA methylase
MPVLEFARKSLHGGCFNDILLIIVSGTYYAAVIENRSDFIGRVVVDVGAGSGILSLFAAQVNLAFWSIVYHKFQK